MEIALGGCAVMQGPALGRASAWCDLCCCHLEIHNDFEQGLLSFTFLLGLSHQAAGLAGPIGQIVASFVEMEETVRGSFLWGGSWSSLGTMFNSRGQLDIPEELLGKLSNRVFKRKGLPARIGVMEDVLKEVDLNRPFGKRTCQVLSSL